MKKEELSVKDLMINDWVNVVIEGEVYPSVITKMDRDTEDVKVAFLAVPGDWEEGDFFDEIQPIPITAEILKANGFMPENLCDYAEKYVCPVEIKKIPQTILEFTFYKGVSADTLFKCWTKPESCDGENGVHICDLKYVHQLQHALRLCGIEKEIEL